MDPQRRLVDLKTPERSTHHVPEELNKKSPHDAVSHPQHKDEDQVGAASDGQAHGEHHQHHDHHVHMVADFRRRFWVSLLLTFPILVFSPMLQKFLGLREAVGLPDDLYALLRFPPRCSSTAAGHFLQGWSMN